MSSDNEKSTIGTDDSANVVSLEAFRKIRDAENDDKAYALLIAQMDKVELLEEMVRFQEQRTRLGKLSLSMMVRGRHLFRALEKRAETQELRILTRSYRRHLDFELQEYQKAKEADHALS